MIFALAAKIRKFEGEEFVKYKHYKLLFLLVTPVIRVFLEM
jgi:hypothetical protein